MHKTLSERYKNRYTTIAHTQKLSITPKLHRSQDLKLPIALSALIAPITHAPKPSFALKAPLLSPTHLLLFLYLALTSSHFPIPLHKQTPLPPCLSLIHRKPVPGYRNAV